MAIDLQKHLVFNEETVKAPNLTDRFTIDDCKVLGGYIWTGYDRDKQSRSQWERLSEAGMNLALQVMEAKTYPWPGASNVVFPLVTIAALQFSTRAYANLIQGTDIVRYRVVYDDPMGLWKQRALRIGRHMSWQCLEQDEGWEETHDRLLISTSIVGTSFIKTRFSQDINGPLSELVLARDLVLDYYTKNINDQFARKTHRFTITRNDIYENSLRGVYRDVRDEPWFSGAAPLVTQGQMEADKRTGTHPPPVDENTPFYALEQCVCLDLDGDGYLEPYVATIEEQSHSLLRLVARVENYDAGVETLGSGKKKQIAHIYAEEYYTKYGFIPNPDGSIYDIGFGVLLGPLNETVNSSINQLLDTGTMRNSLGAWLGRGAKIRRGVTPITPWSLVPVEATGDDLKKNVVPFPKVDPSPITFQLIGLLINYANRIAGATDTVVGENPGQNTPASTYQGMAEQGLQLFSTLFKRQWRSMRDEFRKRYRVNRWSIRFQLPSGTPSMWQRIRGWFGWGTPKGTSQIQAEDYRAPEDAVAPVADPSMPSASLRLRQAMALKQAAMVTPGYDLIEVEKDYLRALQIEDVDRLYPGPGKVPPLPNPKMQVENGKLQLKLLDIQFQRQKLGMEMREEMRLNTAKIYQLQAQAAALLVNAGAEKAAQQLETFEFLINQLRESNDRLESKSKQLMQDGEGDQNDRGDAVGSVEAPPGDQGGDAAAAGKAAGDDGSLGEPVAAAAGTGTAGAGEDSDDE